MMELQPIQEVVVSPRAADELRRIRTENSIPEHHGLRIGVKGGGCSGMSYVLGFDEQPQETDHVLSSEGMSVFVDPKSLTSLSGTTLDYVDGDNGKGFVFENPNANHSCDCGQSGCC
jgi:iron-sulfur cluster assembly protein